MKREGVTKSVSLIQSRISFVRFLAFAELRNENPFFLSGQHQIEQLASMKQMCMWISALRLVVAFVSIECSLSDNGAGRLIDSCAGQPAPRRCHYFQQNIITIFPAPIVILFSLLISICRSVRLYTWWHINRIKAR